jgi:acetyl-CoA carboxylase biotin carboxyl carrier protein
VKKMDIDEQQNGAWLGRVEDLINMLAGSTVSELELTEAGTEIIIRRQSGVVIAAAGPQASMSPAGVPAIAEAGAPASALKGDSGIAITAPMTGVYYSAPSPTAPPFVQPGGMVHIGQPVALIEAMKVFNEIQSEVSGRVVALVASNGEVVQKDDVLIRVQPVS